MLVFLLLSILMHAASGLLTRGGPAGRACVLYPSSQNDSSPPYDDTPDVLQAFEWCGREALYTSIYFMPGTFHIGQVMNTTDLRNVNVTLYGEMKWSTNVSYWRSNSYSVDFQNQSTAWLFGGTNVSFRGHGQGRLNGQGQVWYDENNNTSNQPGRPIGITFINSRNLLVDGLTWVQPQFWSSFISHSQNVTMTNIFMNATSDNGNSTVNTDGTNTWNSKDIVLENWTVQNGDDCIAVKGNTTNLYVNNITCYTSNGMPIGSIGQYPERPDYVENVLFENIALHDSVNAAWIKTWPGVPVGNSTNGDGGGGGLGHVKNVTFRNFQLDNVTLPIYVTQCTYNLNASICDTSRLQLSDITWQNFTGTSTYNVASSIHCSSSAPCDGLEFVDVDIASVEKTLTTPNSEYYLCANIVNQNTTSGIPCNGWAPGDFPPKLTGDYSGNVDSMRLLA